MAGFFQLWRQAPLLFLALQIPEVTSDVLQFALERYFKNDVWLVIALAVPYALFVSAVSAGLTFLVVRSVRQGEGAQPVRAWTTLWANASRLFPASMVSGFLFLLGIPLFALPTIYFMAVYLFVPQIALSTPEKLPLTVYLARSKKLARTRLKTNLAIGLGVTAVSLAYLYFGGVVGTKHAGLTATYYFLSLVSGAIINVGVSHYFLELTGAPCRTTGT